MITILNKPFGLGFVYSLSQSSGEYTVSFQLLRSIQGRIYSQQGHVQKKCGGPSTRTADPIFPENKTGDLF